MRIYHVQGGFRIMAGNPSSPLFFVDFIGEHETSWGGTIEGKIFKYAKDARAALDEIRKRGLPSEIEDPKEALRLLGGITVRTKQRRLLRRVLEETINVRKAVPLGVPLPENSIYREPEREPIDRLAASMFWGAPKR
jgi:hypothetical protein